MPGLPTIFCVSAGLFVLAFIVGTWPSHRITPRWFAITGIALLLITIFSGLIWGVRLMLTSPV